MAIIELNLEKPALKRVESVEDEQIEEKEMTAEVDTDEAVDLVDDETEAEVEVESETDDESGSRIGTAVRRLVVITGVVAGILTARKFRQRRKSGDEQQDLEEDWQTAE
jgi:hypothetical protein